MEERGSTMSVEAASEAKADVESRRKRIEKTRQFEDGPMTEEP
jgi:hypothetical protein